MKKIVIGLLIIAAATACRPELNFVPEQFRSQDAIITGDDTSVSMLFSSKAQTATLCLQTNKHWTASFVNDRAREWCSIPSESGEKGTFTLDVAVKENESYDERVAVILLRCEDIQRTIVVTQKQKEALLLTPGHVELPTEGGSFTIEVNTNVGFTLSVPTEASQWLHWTETKGLIPYKMTIVVDPNTDLNPRQAVLTVKSPLGSEEVSVYQMGEKPALVISSREVLVPTVGGGFEVQITSNLDVEIEFQPASCDWVEEIKSKTISTNTYYFMAAPNETGEAREMFLVFRNAEYELSDELHVRQGALPSFSFTTKRQEVKVPWLTESNDVVRVFWGDGSYQYYAPDLVHSYVEPGMHTVQVEGKTLQPVTISDLEDGMVIDFSLLVKTR